MGINEDNLLSEDLSLGQIKNWHCGNRLKDILREKAVSVASLSKQSGVTSSSIYAMLSNHDIKLKTLLLFLNCLDTSLEYYLYNQERKNSKAKNKVASLEREVSLLQDHVDTLKRALPSKTKASKSSKKKRKK
jgi:lambda repressor-like predicted transcriptional regulator